MLLGDLIAVLEATDLIGILKACTSLPGFIGQNTRHSPDATGVRAMLRTLWYVDNSANSITICEYCSDLP